jgi:hypothetical protein
MEKTGSRLSGAARRPRKLRAHLLAIGRVGAARRQILERRAAVGSGDVTQADVDLVATALVAARERPYPQAIVAVAGGSLSTVTPLFHDWFMRFAYRDADTKTVSLAVPERVPLLVQHLVAQLEMAVREQLRTVADPMQALLGAVQLGEQQALKAQLAAVTAQRDKLQQSLESLLYRVSKLDTELAARRREDEAQQAAVAHALEAIRETLDRVPGHFAPSGGNSEIGLANLAKEVGRLRTALARGSRARGPAASRVGKKRSMRGQGARKKKRKKARSRR